MGGMKRVLAHVCLQLTAVSAVSWVCTGWSLGKADPIFIFGPLLTRFDPRWLLSIAPCRPHLWPCPALSPDALQRSCGCPPCARRREAQAGC